MSKPTEDKKIQIPILILKELLTPSEMRMLKNRYLIINYLNEGLSIRQISQKVKVGTDTVVRVARMMEKITLKGAYLKDKLESSSKTSWVFGKSDE